MPAIENLLRLCGETCKVLAFERKQHVQLMPVPVAISALKKGDAVVAFSRRDVLMLRDQVAANGHPVSVIYGALLAIGSNRVLANAAGDGSDTKDPTLRWGLIGTGTRGTCENI